MRGSPGEAAIVGIRKQDVGHSRGGQVHPGTVQASSVGTRGPVGIASGIDKRSPEQFRRDAHVEGRSFGGHDALSVPGDSSIKRAIKSDRVALIVVPGYIDFTVRSDKRNSANSSSWPGGIIGAS